MNASGPLENQCHPHLKILHHSCQVPLEYKQFYSHSPNEDVVILRVGFFHLQPGHQAGVLWAQYMLHPLDLNHVASPFQAFEKVEGQWLGMEGGTEWIPESIFFLMWSVFHDFTHTCVHTLENGC